MGDARTWVSPRTRVISFSSGKGGVGKTTMVANLGLLWARMGKKTLLIDGDWSLGKLGILLGVRPRVTVDRVLKGERGLKEAIEQVHDNLFLLGSPSGASGFEELDEASRNQLFFELDQLGGEYDLVLFDHSSGLNANVLHFAAASHQHVIVTTPEPTSYTDAYAIMKTLSRRYAIRDFWLLVTQSHHRLETERIISRFSDIARSHLDIRLNCLEMCAWDAKVAESIRRRRPFVSSHPHADLTLQLRGICNTLDRAMPRPSHGLTFFREIMNPFTAR